MAGDLEATLIRQPIGSLHCMSRSAMAHRIYRMLGRVIALRRGYSAGTPEYNIDAVQRWLLWAFTLRQRRLLGSHQLHTWSAALGQQGVESQLGSVCRFATIC
jgi:hypothetical protein